AQARDVCRASEGSRVSREGSRALSRRHRRRDQSGGCEVPRAECTREADDPSRKEGEQVRALVAACLISAATASAAASVDDRSNTADWTTPPPPTTPTPFVPPGATHAVLANGIELVVIPNRTLPLVSMQLVIRNAGASQDTAGKSGLAAFTAD